MQRRKVRVAFSGIRGVREGKSVLVNFAFGCVDTACCFEARNCGDVVGIDQPVASGHRGSIMEERRIAHDSR